MTLREEYEQVEIDHRTAILKRVAKVCFSGSTARVLGNSKQIKKALGIINVDDLLTLKSEAAFKDWFEKQLAKVVHHIPTETTKDKPISDGARQWGYGAKILNLFLMDAVLHCRHFTDEEADRIQYLLYVPLDSKVINRITERGEELPFEKIKEIDSSKKFYDIQCKLGQNAQQVGIPRIWLDDIWANDDD